MRIACIQAATIAVFAILGQAAQAQSDPAYSFESMLPAGPDGFFGLGATVTQEPTIGVTHLDHSLRYAANVGSLVGARTETLLPPQLNDPPGVQHVLFDLTLANAYAGTTADLGITVFGHAMNAPGGPELGLQVEFADSISLVGLGVGTHSNVRVDLHESVGPYRVGESFNEIFGPGENDLTVASGFQFTLRKNVIEPVVLYIDNVRFVIPEPAALSLAAMAATILSGFVRRHLPRTRR
jgi:hypothetical protein